MIRQKRADRKDDECQDADDGTDIIILPVDRQLIQPGYEQIRTSCRRGQVRHRIASGKQVNDVEIIHISRKGSNQVRRRHIQHVGQGDFEESRRHP